VRILAAYFMAIVVRGTAAFTLQNIRIRGNASPLRMVVEIGPTDDDVDPPLPGQMKVSEIKSELDLRQVGYDGCFDRESLELRLNEIRSSGKADPSIIDEFNKRNLEANLSGETLEVSDEMIEHSVGGDGTLPGGMPPDMLKAMLGDDELVAMLQNPRMQEIMKLMMAEGPEELEKAMRDDAEIYECVQKLNHIMGKMNQSL